MIDIKTDIQKNRLYITLDTMVGNENSAELKERMVKAVEPLKPGFDVINDMTVAECGYVSIVPVVKELMSFLVEQQVGRVIRVVGKESVFLNQVGYVTQHYASYEPICVASLEEAEALLVDS